MTSGSAGCSAITTAAPPGLLIVASRPESFFARLFRVRSARRSSFRPPEGPESNRHIDLKMHVRPTANPNLKPFSTLAEFFDHTGSVYEIGVNAQVSENRMALAVSLVCEID